MSEKQTEKVEYESLWCKYDFTREELQEIAETLAMKTQDLAAAESEKKSVMSSYKERIDKIGIEISTAARKFNDKNEMRNIECVVERDFEEGTVTYTRTDNGEVVRSTKMTMGERQMHIDDAIKSEPPEDAPYDPQQEKTNRLMAGETSSL